MDLVGTNFSNTFGKRVLFNISIFNIRGSNF